MFYCVGEVAMRCTFNEKKKLTTEVNGFHELTSMLVTREMGVQNLCRDNKYELIP